MKKYDVLNQSKCEWIEMSEEQLKGIRLAGAAQINLTTPHGCEKVIEVIYYDCSKRIYKNIHGAWVWDH